MDIIPSQPMSRIKSWRRNLKHAYCTQIEEHQITTIADIKDAIMTCRQQQLESIPIEFSLDIKPSGLHPTEGIPVMFYDQLSTIATNIEAVMQEHRPPAPQEPYPLDNSAQEAPTLTNHTHNASGTQNADAPRRTHSEPTVQPKQSKKAIL